MSNQHVHSCLCCAQLSEALGLLQRLHDECSITKHGRLNMGPMMEPSEQSVLAARAFLEKYPPDSTPAKDFTGKYKDVVSSSDEFLERRREEEKCQGCNGTGYLDNDDICDWCEPWVPKDGLTRGEEEK